MKGCLGGTFDVLHQGHVMLFDAAFKTFEELVVGVTTDNFATENKKRNVRPFSDRKKTVSDYLSSKAEIPFEIVGLDDPFGPALSPDMDGIVVSEETEHVTALINRKRCQDGLMPLEVVTVPLLMIDGEKISARNYGTSKGVSISLGSTNQAKRQGTLYGFLRYYPRVDIDAFDVSQDMTNQPRDEELLELAKDRCLLALERKENDYGVGIEAGTISLGNLEFAVQVAVVSDGEDFLSAGMSPGCLLPESIYKELDDGATLGEAAEKMKLEMDPYQGAVGHLSKGVIDRVKLSQLCVSSALIPLKRPETYGRGDGGWPLKRGSGMK